MIFYCFFHHSVALLLNLCFRFLLPRNLSSSYFSDTIEENAITGWLTKLTQSLYSRSVESSCMGMKSWNSICTIFYLPPGVESWRYFGQMCLFWLVSSTYCVRFFGVVLLCFFYLGTVQRLRQDAHKAPLLHQAGLSTSKEFHTFTGARSSFHFVIPLCPTRANPNKTGFQIWDKVCQWKIL